MPEIRVLNYKGEYTIFPWQRQSFNPVAQGRRLCYNFQSMKKLVVIFAISAFLAPGFAPLALSHGGPEVAEYCEMSGGPCTHGEACPMQHGNHGNQGKNSRHGQDSPASHGKQGPHEGHHEGGSGKDCMTFIGCAHGGGPSSAIDGPPMPFALGQVPRPNTFETVTAIRDSGTTAIHFYSPPTERPPRTA